MKTERNRLLGRLHLLLKEQGVDDDTKKEIYAGYGVTTECARLQTIPAWYEWVVSDSQIYRLLGNGWTVEVIKCILEHWDDLWELDVNYLFERNGK